MLTVNRAVFFLSVTALASAGVASGCATTAPDVDLGVAPQATGDSGGGSRLGGGSDGENNEVPPVFTETDDAQAPTDASRSDGASRPDAGPPAPNPGDPCTDFSKIIVAPCGACGSKEAVCLREGDAAVGTVSAYGACVGEVPNGCQPGTTEQTSCGLCGKASRVCGNACSWITGQCAGEPAQACEPGKEELSGAGCPADQFRTRTCAATCTWGAFAQTCTEPPRSSTKLDLVPGDTAFIVVNLAANKIDKRVSGTTCPCTLSTTAKHAHEYVEINNPTGTARTVTIFTSQAPGGDIFDTMMAVYPARALPRDETARKTCTAVNDQSFNDTAITGNTDFSIAKNIVIGAGAGVLVYVGGYYPTDDLDEVTSGPVKLNVLTP